MKLSELKNFLETQSNLAISLPNQQFIPAHFHLTEAGLLTRHFIDCGGTERITKTINLQLWVANDVDHRLSPQKLIGILDYASKQIGLSDIQIEVEYQGTTIEKYGLEAIENTLQLVNLQTDCLAQDACGIPAAKTKITLQALSTPGESCAPGSGCC